MRLAIFDLDGTLLTCDSFVAFVRYVLLRRVRAWRHLPRMAGVLALFGIKRATPEHLKEALLRAIDGLDAREQEAIVSGFVEELMATRIRKSVAELRDHYASIGHHTVLISASPDVYVMPLGKRFGFDSIICTRLAERAEGGKASRIVGPNCKGTEKISELLKLIDDTQIDWPGSFACSDHVSDLPLLTRVGTPLAIDPEHRLRAHARAVGWKIES